MTTLGTAGHIDHGKTALVRALAYLEHLEVAAADGVMPQTREHATVLAALGVDVGVVAVTKSDVADPARALAYLEHLDAEHVTLRHGDERVLRRRRA
jgi:selenocysteine-specific translation elongation factor